MIAAAGEGPASGGARGVNVCAISHVATYARADTQVGPYVCAPRSVLPATTIGGCTLA
jgi:hypothetical protein